MEPLIKISSSDNEIFEVPRSVICLSNTLGVEVLELANKDDVNKDGDNTDPIPCQKVTAPILKKVIEWCTHHSPYATPTDEAQDSIPISDADNRKKRTDDIGDWDREFLQVDQETLFELILAANYLDIKGLLDVTCKTFANMIKGKSPVEIRRQFNIKNDHTPEEKEQLRKKNEWCIN